MSLWLASEEWHQLEDKSHYEVLAQEDMERVRGLKKAAGIPYTKAGKSRAMKGTPQPQEREYYGQLEEGLSTEDEDMRIARLERIQWVCKCPTVGGSKR